VVNCDLVARGFSRILSAAVIGLTNISSGRRKVKCNERHRPPLGRTSTEGRRSAMMGLRFDM